MKGKINIWPVLLMLTLVLGTVTSAQEENSDQAALPPMASQVEGAGNEPAEFPSLTESVLPSLTRIAVSLIVIVAIIYLTVFLLRKMSGNRIGGKKGTNIQVVEQTFLAPKKSVCLIRLADRAVLLGITDTNINLLTELDWESLPQDAADKSDRVQAGFPGFLNEAAGKLFGVKKKGAEREPAA